MIPRTTTTTPHEDSPQGQTAGQRENDLRLDEQSRIAIPVVEETLEVGKREVQSGGVHVERRVVERPVEETVSLREEHVSVERRLVDRPATPADLSGFHEGSMDVIEHSEQAVVAKTARVVEEVIVGKEVTQRTERITDTVRHTEVSVHELGGLNQNLTVRGYDAYDDDFRTNFTSTYGASYGTYEDFSPAYLYGYHLATANNYQGRDWSTFEPEARTRWETRNPGTWERVKDSVRYAWARVTGKL